MNEKKLFRLMLYSCMAAWLSTVCAAEALPKSMSGRWAVTTPRGEVSNTWSIIIDKQDGKGAIEGRVTHYGITCGAKDEPMSGTFDGSVLILQSRLRPDVYSARAGGNCGSGKITWTLRKREGRDDFEGEAVFEGVQSVKVSVYLNP